MRRTLLLAALGLALPGASLAAPQVAGQAVPAPQPPPPAARLVSIGEALRNGLFRNPNLLDAADAFRTAHVENVGVRSTFLPQASPFYLTSSLPGSDVTSKSFGLTLSEQFPFGPRIDGSARFSKNPVDPTLPETAYAADWSLGVAQPLLRHLDPATTREPLRQARRRVEGAERSLVAARRRTVLAVYQAYLAVVEAERALQFAEERLERARRLTAFSRARFEAGSISRLDVLRAEQQEANADVSKTAAINGLADAKDALRRATGMPVDAEFSVAPPLDLPQTEPPLADAAPMAIARRPEAVEQRDLVTDAQFAVRIAKSEQLPSLDASLFVRGTGVGGSYDGAWRGTESDVGFALSSQYGLNFTALAASRRSAEIALEGRRRNAALFEADLAREVNLAYRRLDAVLRDHSIAAANLEVAELQLKVAQLRFEKGLSDNFPVVDAENLLNSTRLFELDSRFRILTARLDCLYASGALDETLYLDLP